MVQSVHSDTTTLGPTDLLISQMGVGAWAWGADIYWGRTPESDIHAAYESTMQQGINLIDTAEMYGFGRSERNIGQLIPSGQSRPVLATKFAPLPMRFSGQALLRALKRSLARLGVNQVELYQIHWPTGNFRRWTNALADALDTGLARFGGVSNFNVEQTRQSFALLAERGHPLVSNQVIYSLLDRAIEFNGLLDLCRELKITVLAYSPIAQGLLTGKFTPDNPPSGVRGRRFGGDKLARAMPIVDLMREIGQAHGGKTPAQVALNWTICKGTVPIPGARTASQAAENAGALGWRLTPDEVAALDQVSEFHRH